MIAPYPGTRTIEHAAKKAGTLSPPEQALLWDMEESFWTDDMDNARATTLKNAVFIFPYPPGIVQGELIWDQMRERTGWRTVAMTERRVTRHGDAAVLAYRAVAARAELARFTALCASSYIQHDDGWVRILHQQTPAV